MIYLIRTKYENYTLLKIGFTEDNNFKHRLSQYKLHNPLCEVLYTIPGGTEENEKNLHYLFRDFLYPDYGREWFYKDPSIYAFFETHTTKESLGELKGPIDIERRKDYIKNYYIDKALLYEAKNNSISFMIVSREYDKLLESDFINYSDEELNIYFKSRYPTIDFDTMDKNSSAENLPEDIRKALDKFESKTTFIDKMKYVETESTLMDENKFRQFLSHLPNEFINYITVLGFSEIKTCGYQRSRIIMRLSKKSTTKEDMEKIKENIYLKFIVGKKYTKASVKEILREIYEANDYKTSPKASDPEKYFELKSCQIQNVETGKRDMAFEIIKIKKEEGDL